MVSLSRANLLKKIVKVSLIVSPPEEVIAVGRGLCSLYIRTKLKKSGLFNKKLGLVRVRSAMGTMITCSNVVREVFPGK